MNPNESAVAITSLTLAEIRLYSLSKSIFDISYLVGSLYAGRKLFKKVFQYLFSTKLKGDPLA